MADAVLRARVEEGTGDRCRVLAPAVGLWTGHPSPGRAARLGGAHRRAGPGESRSALWRSPRGPPGASSRRCRETAWSRSRTAALLFELAPLTGEALQAAEASAPPSILGAADLPPGARAVVAPTDGVFYGRPSPGAPAFVTPGQQVRAGQAIGLVEVMKTFNQVLYGGADLPDVATVLEVRARGR